MKIGILGTRGVPNFYGGFEQFAQFLSKGLVAKGCEVYVYNSHNHPFQKKNWQGVQIIHRYDPEYKIGLAGQFIYDLNCILDSRKRNFDLILQLGYTTSSIWGWLFPKNAKTIYNMDGIEWKREKYNRSIRVFLRFAEYLGVKYAGGIVADSHIIEAHFKEQYNKPVTYIPYGATEFRKPNADALKEFHLEPYEYNLIIARLQPDNNIETILKGLVESGTDKKLVVIGNHNNAYGKYLKKTFNDKRIVFLGAIYNMDGLNNIRYHSNLYFHGHSAGGTNPSLLEAMAASGLIFAYNSRFNKSVLADNAFYFENHRDITSVLSKEINKQDYENFIINNLKAVREQFSWNKIIIEYFQFFCEIMKESNNG